MAGTDQLIDAFIKRYMKEYDYYEQASYNARVVLEGLLQQAGIRAILSNRAKDPSRLEEKIRQRFKPRKHKKVEDFYDEIVDLAGIRIALYFPGERAAVKKIIEQNFVVVGDAQEFPEKNKNKTIGRKFSGYGATHYRVKVDDKKTSGDSRYCEALIEIQLASVLMHAWSEVEHDLVYKPRDGDLSKSEVQLLDQINGLMIAGEIALEQLQSARIARLGMNNKAFRDHYELADFLAGFIFENYPDKSNRPTVGNVDQIYDQLVASNINTPKLVGDYIKELPEINIGYSITDTIKKKLIEENKYNFNFDAITNNYRLSPAVINSVKYARIKLHVKSQLEIIKSIISSYNSEVALNGLLHVDYDNLADSLNITKEEAKEIYDNVSEAEFYLSKSLNSSSGIQIYERISSKLSKLIALLSKQT